MSKYMKINCLSGDGTFDAYIAEPTAAPHATIIVIQEVFGVNAGIRAKCDGWAKLGYLALAPDIFWRLEPNVDLDPDVPEDLQKGIALVQKFDAGKAVEDIEALIRAARKQTNGGKVGVVGYCMGGRLAYMSVTRTDIDASVSYYGGGIDKQLNEIHGIARPLMLHLPMADAYIPATAQAAIHDALDNHPRVTIHDYPDLDHGFATEMGHRRDEQGAQLADSRTTAFFAEHLR